ncbi:hypothetical protein EDL98_09040 [Ornithobacterium rhinotracheale]|uniref:hypothetical protein n=1 Tax=Ornithobacterium rhinotracheale TaxID=28251 RepID=UPI00129CDED7|nr:hypothetical protein [Ornithobacterium rhinotracheale]MRJ08596.1 hypothetical protein [Ornithobacterium rhinotracheale]MRJ11218.1 hypothetical protein [Ornithobacterium rhinotracheale]UOH76958.1 hypothetical protein MT996_06925 [Ornithobacterium rhinotracheale]
MSNFWNELKNLFRKNVLNDAEETSDEIDISYPEEIPTDERFVTNYTKAGGNFFYCENMKIASQYLKTILENEKLGPLICFDENLQKWLTQLGVFHIHGVSATADSCLIKCISLNAFNGSIILSSKDLGGRFPKDLPHTFIVFARLSQIENNLKDAMIKINRSKESVGSITSIGGTDIAHHTNLENSLKPKIYLLLLEDE